MAQNIYCSEPFSVYIKLDGSGKFDKIPIYAETLKTNLGMRTTMEISLFDFLCYPRNFLCTQCYNIVFYVLYFYVHEF